MALQQGTRLGAYEIISPLGAGGMGEVYRAHDTKLQRDVALKILPETMARDAQRMARFEREAQVLASLNHPKIAAIYGLEESNSIRALVMELVEGETLGERIKSGEVPLKEALPVAEQIAEALEYAHEHGVIHRDLKPANVKITPEGTVKVLDFGLAKVLDAQDSTATMDMANSPTLSAMATQAGMILGTAAYMSPEQAKGQRVDRRADIWAFGCVLFEMLSARKPFEGEAISDVLAAVIMKDPDWDALPATMPASIRKLLRRCLTKDRKQRLQAIGDARFEIEEALVGVPEDTAADAARAPAISAWRQPLTWILVLVIALLTVLLVWNPWRDEKGLQPSLNLSFNLPPGAPLAPPGTMPLGVGRRSLAISPDGTRLAYVTLPVEGTRFDLSGQQRLLVFVNLNERHARTYPLTAGAYSPFFSPDGNWVGFFAGGKLKKVAFSGGTPIVLADAPQGLGGTWALDGTIYFTPDEGKQVFKVPSTGGEVQKAALIKSSRLDQVATDILPDRKGILVSETPGGVVVYSRGSGEPKTVIPYGWDARYIPTGQLIFAQPGKLLAVPFDLEKLAVTGPAVTVLEGVQTSWGLGGNGQYAISQSGMLAYVPGKHTEEGNFVWLDRKGNKKPLGLPPGSFGGFTLSPDGNKVAIPIFDGSKVDIWIYDTTRGTPTRFTFDGKSQMGPAWTPDGRKLLFVSTRDGVGNIFVKPVDGSEKAVQLTKYKTLTDIGRMSLEGKTVPILTLLNAQTNSTDIFLLPLGGEHSSGAGPAEAVPYLQTPFEEMFPAVSPDGRWMAYYSNETGRWEIYVQSIEGTGGQPSGTERVRISSAGGEEPTWSRAGRELFYRWGKKVYVVDITLGPKFRAGTPRVLFDGPFVNLPGWSYDVSPDGKHFLVVENADLEKAGKELGVITNFFDQVRRLATSGKN